MNELIIFLAGFAAASVVFIIVKLFQRIKALEEGQRTQLPYNAIKELENLKAVLNEGDWSWRELEEFAHIQRMRQKAAHDYYERLRNGEYDPDKPAGRRPGD